MTSKYEPKPGDRAFLRDGPDGPGPVIVRRESIHEPDGVYVIYDRPNNDRSDFYVDKDELVALRGSGEEAGRG